MTISQSLKWAIAKLKEAGVGSPALDAEVLLAHTLITITPSPESPPIKGGENTSVPSPSVASGPGGPPARRGEGRVRGRAWLYVHPEYVLASPEEKRFRNFIRRRLKREPVAYILGHREFYGLDFLVNRYVLIPRPETELLVEEVLKQITRYTLHATRYTIIDVGTGSGAIAVAVARAVMESRRKAGNQAFAWTPIRFIAADISRDALRVARLNARRHGVADRITFLQGNLLMPIIRNFANSQFRNFIITANLPYLLTSEWRATAPEIKKWEPRGALDGGKDGLKYYRELFGQLSVWVSLALSQPVSSKGVGDVTVKRHRYGQRNRHPITVLCEICPEQTVAFKKLVARIFPSAKKLTIVKDIAGRNRVVIVKI